MDKLVVETIAPGNGQYPKKGDLVGVQYTGMFEDEKTVFDTSKSRKDGSHFTFTVGANRVIQGWEKGITQISLGEEAKFRIHSDLAYGKDGYPGFIPPNANLVFIIKLMTIN